MSRSASSAPRLSYLFSDDQVSEIEHVDLLELARRAVFAGHDVDREIDQIDDFGIALTDARGFDNDQVETERSSESRRCPATSRWLPDAAGGSPSNA